jgi:uncharacterized protein YeaO (DUF488 family)
LRVFDAVGVPFARAVVSRRQAEALHGILVRPNCGSGAHHAIRIKRVYEPPARGDGFRVLVDRVWPRGLSKDKAGLDHWAKEIAPSTALRQWFAHDPDKWPEFRRRYRKELRGRSAALRDLLQMRGRRRMTLLFSARDSDHNQAVVLAEVLKTLAAGR